MVVVGSLDAMGGTGTAHPIRVRPARTTDACIHIAGGGQSPNSPLDHSAHSSSPFSQVPGAAAQRPHQAPPVRHRHRLPLPLHPRARRLPQRPVPLAVSSGRRGRPRGDDAGRRVPGAAARGRGRGGRPHARAGGGRREPPPPQGEAEGPGQEDDPNTHTPAPILFSRDASSCKEGRGGGGGDGSVGVLPLHRRGALKIHEEEAQPTEDRAMRAVQAAVARKVFDKMTKSYFWLT
ncbi:formin-like protein 18 [Triticum urartu]|uniref:formin-like protein 18 n=1 Tax=Triticum urartu TaxID=4572 RepID=UPI0020440417|nr:formin-like protein 18 [Triticum urartu]